MTRLALGCAALFLGLTLTAAAQDSRPTSRPAGAEGLAAQVAAAAGLAKWDDVTHLRFSWHHTPSGRVRHYDWDVAAGEVSVASGEGQALVVPVAGFGEADVSEEANQAHRAFVNDSFWFLFPLHAAWDEGLTAEDLGDQAVPGFDDLGTRRALALRYGDEAGGYTPGDLYVLYLDEDDRPVAWAFHRGGAEEPTLVTRVETAAHGPLVVPVRFAGPDGAEFIRVDGIEVVTAD